jgi:hypothetical protein
MGSLDNTHPRYAEHAAKWRDVDPQNLMATRQSDARKRFERMLHELKPDGELSELDRIRDLAISVGSIALK